MNYTYRVRVERKEFFKTYFIILLLQMVLTFIIVQGMVTKNYNTAVPFLLMDIVFLPLSICAACDYFRRALYVDSERKEYLYVPAIGSPRFFHASEIAKVEFAESRGGIDSREVIGYSNSKKKLFVITRYMKNADRFIEELYADDSEYVSYYDSISFEELVHNALNEIDKYTKQGREMPFYMTKSMLEEIRFELLKMIQVKNREIFYPSYEALIMAKWDYRNKLAHDLMDVAEAYRVIFAYVLPAGVSERDYERAKKIVEEICKDRKFRCSNETLSSLSIEVIKRVLQRGGECNAETIWKTANEVIKKRV